MRHRASSADRVSTLLFLAGLALAVPDAYAADRAGSMHFSVDYQYISVDGFEGTAGEVPIGTVDTHVWNFEFEYAATDRLTLSAGIPLLRRRYQGTFPHDPRILDPPRDAEFIDDGEYHTDFQDFHLGIRYLWKTRPLIVEPFVYLGIPSNDYPFFAHSAVGQNLWKVDVGANLVYFPTLSDFFYGARVARVFVEETLGTNIDHWRVDGQVGYFFTPRVAGRAFLMVKEGNGLDFPDDFPPPRTDERWYQHDRMVKHNFVNAGVGVDWAVSERYGLSFSVLRMIHAENIHIVEYAVNFGLSVEF